MCSSIILGPTIYGQNACFEHLTAVFLPLIDYDPLSCAKPNLQCFLQLSPAMLAPLGLGFGVVIWKNATLIFPRICFICFSMYMLWFFNSVVQNSVLYLRRQVNTCNQPISKERSEECIVANMWLCKDQSVPSVCSLLINVNLSYSVSVY